MTIRHKLTLRYAGITAAIFSLAVFVLYLFSEQTREYDFFRYLAREAVTKANFFLNDSIDARVMQLIYHNNRKFIDEVEVAVYTTDSRLLYHDAQDIDIVKETPKLIKTVIQNKKIEFYVGRYQCIAMIYVYKGTDYLITAAAHDSNGFAKQKRFTSLLAVLWISGLIILTILGNIFARAALRPVSKIVDEVDAISESNLDTRLVVKKEHDELDELSETFNRMLDRLEQSFANQKMFINNVTHELRTPLAALMAEIEIALLRQRRTNSEYKAIISNVLDDAKNINNLITGLLDLAKANYDVNLIAAEELRLDEVLLEARATVLKANPGYSVDLVFNPDLEDDTMITVRGNEYLLKTAFVNLIENNCKFSENKSSCVQISFHAAHSIISFSDSGIGIPAEEIDRIFDPFFRGSNSSHIKGQGIGMALTQRIVLLYNGSITVHSDPHQGTTFIVQIPHI